MSVRGTKRFFIIGFVLTCLTWGSMARAADAPQTLVVADPYIEMHTGPGVGYPVFYVIERGKTLQVIKQRTDWFKVRTANNKLGWISRTEMQQTLTATGKRTKLKTLAAEDYSGRTWEAGILGGNFQHSKVMTAYAGYYFTDNFSAELSLSQILSGFSSSTFINVNLALEPFPEWDVSPYFTIGTGVIRTQSSSSLVKSRDSTDSSSNVGIGARMYFTKQFLIRLEVKNYVIFTSNNNNEEVTEWKIGFGVFF